MTQPSEQAFKIVRSLRRVCDVWCRPGRDRRKGDAKIGECMLVPQKITIIRIIVSTILNILTRKAQMNG